MNELEFQNILKGKGIEVSERQLKQFQKYYERKYFKWYD